MAKHRLRVLVGHDDDGQPVVKQIGANSELALADMIVKAVIQSGQIAEFMPGILDSLTQPKPSEKPAEKPPKIHRLDAYMKHWRETYKQGVAQTTSRFYDAKQGVILKRFGSKYIEDITPEDVQVFANERAKQCNKKTVKDDLAFLRMVLDSAMADGIISQNPAKDRRVLNTAQPGTGTRALTREEITAIRKAIPSLQNPQERMYLALLANTSMRREEALGLQWEDIDFDHDTISINHALVYPGGVPQIKGTKTESGRRVIPMNGQLKEILSACRHLHGYVICNNKGKPYSTKGYTQLWNSIKSHIELYGATARNFRTTFATQCVASGVDIRTVQALMGHTDPSMTLEVYTKVEPSMLPKAMKTLDEFLNFQ